MGQFHRVQPQNPDDVALNTLVTELSDHVDALRKDLSKLDGTLAVARDSNNSNTNQLMAEFRALSEYVTAKLAEPVQAAPQEPQQVAPEQAPGEDPRDTAINALQLARTDVISTFLAPAASVLVGLLKHTEEGLQQDLSELTPQQAQQQTRDIYEYFEQQLLDAIRVLGFEAVEAKPGDTFDRKLHKTVRTVKTADASKHDTIHSVLAPGFGHPGALKTSIPANVVVFRYDASASESPQTDTPTK